MSDSFFKVNRGVNLNPQSSEPLNPIDGDIYYDTSLSRFRKYQASAWSDLGSGGGSGTGDDVNTLQYQASFTDLFDESATRPLSSLDSTKTTGTYSASKAMWTLSYDADTQTVTGTGTAMTMNTAPAFTVVAGDMLIVGSEVRRITVVTSQTSYTVESAFTVDPAAAACCVSQCVHSKELYGLALDGDSISSAFAGVAFQNVLVDYDDNSTPGSDVASVGVIPNAAWSASHNGTLYTQVFTRTTNQTDSLSDQLLPAEGTALYLRFFANKTSGAGTINILRYKVFLMKKTASAGNTALNSALCMTDSSATPVGCSQPTVVVGKTRITLSWPYTLGLNPGTPYGSIDVYINGQIVPRYINASLTPDASYKEIDSYTIELDQDYSGVAYDAQIIQRLVAVDASSANAIAIADLYTKIGVSGVEVSEAIAKVSAPNQRTSSSNRGMLTENFMNPKNTTYTLAKAYTASDANIYIDQNQTVLSTMDATSSSGTWAATGAQAGAIATEATITLGGGSLKTVVTSGTSGTHNGLGFNVTTAFGLGQRKLRIAVYLSAITNITGIRIRLSSDTSDTNGSYWDFATASGQADGSAITGAAWNFFEVDPTVTATGTAGTGMNVNSVARVVVTAVTNATTTFTFYADSLRYVDFMEPPLCNMSIYDGTNQNHFRLASGSNGIFALAATIGNSYTIAAGVIKRSTMTPYSNYNGVTLSNSRAEFTTGLTGAVTLNQRWHKRVSLGETLSAKTLNWSVLFNTSNCYQVSSVVSTTSTKLSVTGDFSSEFANTDYVWFVNRVWTGTEWQYEKPTRVQLSASTTYTAGPPATLTLTHAAISGVDTNYWVIAENVKMLQFMGARTATETLTEATPSDLVVVGDPAPWLFDAFDRTLNYTDGDMTFNINSPGNNWSADGSGAGVGQQGWATGIQNVSTGHTACLAVYACSYINSSGASSRAYRTYENLSTSKLPIRVRAQFYWNPAVPASGNVNIAHIKLGTVPTYGGSMANTVGTELYVASAGTAHIYLAQASTSWNTSAYAVTQNVWYNVITEYWPTFIRFKYWLETAAEPAAWTDTQYATVTLGDNGMSVATSAYGNNTNGAYSRFKVDNLIVEPISPDFYLKGSVVGLSGNTLTMTADAYRKLTSTSVMVRELNGIIIG
jgi:hypothetical protein